MSVYMDIDSYNKYIIILIEGVFCFNFVYDFCVSYVKWYDYWFIIDLCKVDYIDSVGFGMLFNM